MGVQIKIIATTGSHLFTYLLGIVTQIRCHLFKKFCRRLEKRLIRNGLGVLLLHDNAPAHTSGIATSTAAECGHELLPHPLYSPNLAPFVLVVEIAPAWRMV